MNLVANRWFKLSIGIAVAAGFSWLLVRELDWAEMQRAFSALSLSAIPVALTLLAFGWSLRIVRWWWMLRALEPTVALSACIVPFLSAMAVNNVMPFRAGDVLRIVGFQYQLRSPALRVAGTMVIERLLDVAVLVGLFFLGLLALPGDTFPRGFVVGVTWLAGALALALVALLLFAPRLGRVKKRLLESSFFASRRWLRIATRHIARLIEALSIVRSPKLLLVIVSLSIVSWVCEGAVFAILVAAFQIDTAPLAPWLSMAAGTLATTIPSTPGYVGTFDYFTAEGLAAYGVSAELAAAFALVVHVMLWLPVTVVGLPALLILRRTAAPSPSAQTTPT